MKNRYIAWRTKYQPKQIRVIFILESPPASRGYLYDPDGRTSEILFRAFMRLVGHKPTTKDEGLKRLTKKGWLIVDPIYEPVNKLPDKVADEMILKNYPKFKADLHALTGGRDIPVIIVKANVIKLLEAKLVEDGFNVLNNGLMVPFPMHYHADSFHERTKSLMRRMK